MEQSERAPVIVGVGDIIDRPADLLQSREPLTMMEQAARAAERDAGARLIGDVDSIDVVKQVSVAYPDLARQLADRLELDRNCRAVVSTGSGNGPLRELQAAAARIQRGESTAALVCGAEAQWSVDQARKRGIELPWMPKQGGAGLFQIQNPQVYANPLAIRYGLITPSQVYPLYENAAAARWGQTPAEAREESAEIWSAMSEVASRNPFAWLPRRHDASQIAEPSATNRPLAWPYSKLMVAQPSVNLGSAVLLTSVGHAREAGVPADRMIYIGAGASALDIDDYLMRDRYDENIHQTTVLQSILAQLDWRHSQFDLVELYSCFPVVPKMARRVLGIASGTPLSVAGGLTFMGAPLHNYMSHAITAMTRQLRAKSRGAGLLYGQGGNVTKHHATVLTRKPPRTPWRDDVSVQVEADRARGPIPALVDRYAGPGQIETFTVQHDRDGAAAYGAVMVRIESGRRTLARVPPDDGQTLETLTSLTRSPVGAPVRVRIGSDDVNFVSLD
ncbi:MAG: hypothetical protein AB7G13_23295 [Lautropia sp.]